MSFCPKCGREIIDESLGCPICGVKENTRLETTQADDQPAEKVNSFTVEDAKGTYQKFESTENTRAAHGQAAVPTQNISLSMNRESILP